MPELLLTKQLSTVKLVQAITATFWKYIETVEYVFNEYLFVKRILVLNMKNTNPKYREF